MVLFCQMDVTGRTEEEPAAERLVNNILRYAQAWKPKARRTAVYTGGEEGRAWLEAAGIHAADVPPPGEDVLMIRPDDDGQGLCLELGSAPAKATMRRGEHIAAWFPAQPASSALAGVAPADVYNRDPREIPLVSGGAEVLGDGVLAVSTNVVFYQMPPFAYQETDEKHFNQRRSFERSSFALSRLLGNMGVSGETPLLERFGRPVGVNTKEARWDEGLYLLKAVEWDDPYRFFGW